VLEGFAGQLVSPGKGLSFFAPPIVLAVIGWRQMIRHDRAFGSALLVGSAVYLLVFASIANWSGADAVGPRFAVPVVVLLWAPIVFVLGNWSRYGAAAKSAIVAVCVAGALVQIGLATTDDAAITRMHDNRLHLEPYQSSQIIYSWHAAWDGVRGRPPYPPSAWDPVDHTPAPRFDLWWTGASPPITNLSIARVVALMMAVGAVAAGSTALRRGRTNR